MEANDKPRLLLDSLVLGVVGGLAAQLFMWLLAVAQKLLLNGIAGYRPPGVAVDGGVLHQTVGPHGLWLVPVVTTLGGLISGVLVYKLAPETEGHGTDSVVKALHWTGGTIRARVAPVKMITSAITIGSGGSAGREGPTAQIAASFGSIYADWLKRPEREKRLLVLMGMAAGLSAVFRSPIGTAIFAVEVLYSGIEFEAEALLYCMLSAIVAYAVNGWFVGWEPLFNLAGKTAPMRLGNFGWYVVLGISSGIVATVLPEVFYRIRDGFRALPVPPWVKPALGGLLLGLLALKLPEVLGGGYGWIQMSINGQLALKLLLLLMGAKILALSLSVASGGSGGVFAPSLYVGAMLGGVFAQVSHHAPAGLVIVGMAAVFGGAARVPIATLLMVAEMTGGYQLLVPAGLAVMLSYVIQVHLSQYLKYGSLYEAQVAGRAESPAHQAEQVETAMRLLEHGSIAWPEDVTHVHLAALLQRGLELDLPDGSRLTAGALRPDSSWVGKQIGKRPAEGAAGCSRIVSVVRGKNAMAAKPDSVLLPGDRLIVLVQPDGVESLSKELAPLGSEDGDGSHLSHEEMKPAD